MSVVPGPASQDAVFKCVYASQGLQCGQEISLEFANDIWVNSIGISSLKNFAKFLCKYYLAKIYAQTFKWANFRENLPRKFEMYIRCFARKNEIGKLREINMK